MVVVTGLGGSMMAGSLGAIGKKGGRRLTYWFSYRNCAKRVTNSSAICYNVERLVSQGRGLSNRMEGEVTQGRENTSVNAVHNKVGIVEV